MDSKATQQGIGKHRRHSHGTRTARRRLALMVAVVVLIPCAISTPAIAVPADCLGAAVTVMGATDGPDVLDGTAGNDVIAGGSGNDMINGGGGNDTICGGLGSDTIAGAMGDDVIFGEEFAISTQGGVDTIEGGDGVDLILGGPGDDGIDGGSGADAVLYALALSPVTVNLGTGEVSGGEGEDQLSAVEGVVGSVSDDSLTGDGGDNLLAGLGGADVMTGKGGFDLALFWTLDDPEFGVIASLRDRIAVGESGKGHDELYGFEGLVGTDEEVGDRLVGSGRSDLLSGGGGADTLGGGSGTDLLLGGDGDDTVAGQGGDDILSAGPGRDRVLGGPGEGDFATYTFAGVPANASLADHEAIGEGRDRLRTVEGLQGSPFGDTLEGDAGPNALFGSGGDDSIFGGDGADFLDGGDAVDDLHGGLGADQCVNGETVTECKTRATKQPPTTSRTRALQVQFSDIGADRAIEYRLRMSSVQLPRGVFVTFPTFCQRDAGGYPYSIRADMPIGVSMISQTSGFDAQRVWYRGVLYHGGQPTGISSGWFYTDLNENVPTSTSTWVAYGGQAGQWFYRYPIDASGAWSVKAELWWWDDERGWLNPNGSAIIPPHQDFDGVHYNTYCSRQLATAVVLTGIFGFYSNWSSRSAELFP